MTEAQVRATQREIEEILEKHDIHYTTELVRSPILKFVNIFISIKVTKE